MATYVIILTSIGTDAGPFNLYSDIDGFIAPFAINVTSAELLAGYSTSLIPVGTIEVKVLSISGCTNYEYLTLPITTSSTTTTFPYNFDVENLDWSAIGVTDEASFEAFMMGTYTNMASIVISDFSIVNNGAIKCNLVCTPAGSFHSLMWSSLGMTKFNSLSGLDLVNYIIAPLNNLTEMEGFEPLVNLVAIELQSNPITTFKGLNTCTLLIYIDMHSCLIDTIESMPDLTQVDILNMNDNLITTAQWDNLNPWALAVVSGGNINTTANIDLFNTSTTFVTLSGKSWTIL